MEWHYYFRSLINEFCENEGLGLKAFLFMQVRQINGALKSQNGHEKVTRIPFLLIFYSVNFIVLSYIPHKEMRFLTTLIQIGQIAQAYVFSIFYEIRCFALKILQK